MSSRRDTTAAGFTPTITRDAPSTAHRFAPGSDSVDRDSTPGRFVVEARVVARTRAVLSAARRPSRIAPPIDPVPRNAKVSDIVPAYYDNRRTCRHLKGNTVDVRFPIALITEVFVLVHLTGMAILVGAFIVNMRAEVNFPFKLMVRGASIQLFTGTILVGLAYMGDDAPDNLKITVKTLLATGALIAAILGAQRQSHGDTKLQPFFHAAGGLAVINLVIAVLWNPALYV
jgi:hypothetical protein